MDVERVFHMKGGLGETSYAQNSSLQKKSMAALKHITIDTVVDVCNSESPKSLAVADLGCSSGSNALSLIADIVSAVDDSKKSESAAAVLPEFMVFLNDLPTNDFNSTFAALPEFIGNLERRGGRGTGSSPSVFIAGVPGSFYGRLFPEESLHFVHSCYSLHWLSQVPPGLFDEGGKPINKGKMYISETSPPAVPKVYFKQFQKDFSRFLESRSAELISGGRMVLILLGRRSQDHGDKGTTFLWEILAQSFAAMVSQGVIEQEKLDSYNTHFYAPNLEEIRDQVHKEGSFTIDRLEMYEVEGGTGDPLRNGKITAMAVRAIQESMIRHHFGEGMVDGLFQKYGEMLGEAMAKEEHKAAHLIVVLRKSS